MSEYTVVRQEAITKLDAHVPFGVGAILACGVMTGWGSAVNAAKVQAGSTACIIGCGGVGLNVIQGAALSGAAKVIAIDISDERLEQAKAFGATHTVRANKDDKDFDQVARDVKAINNGRGADYAFECTAVPALGSAPLKLIRSAGTAVQASGIEQRIDFDCELFEWDKIYINPLYDLYGAGKIKLDELISKTYTLENVADGFADMLAGRLAKGVIIIDPEQ
jgi:S-(hydroxymethyl)glutathione dehydrogenase/alcohol dehydrogenase